MRSRAALLALLIPAAAGAQSPAPVAGPDQAYILLGAVDQSWFSDLVRSLGGVVDPVEDLQPLMGSYVLKYGQRGWAVQVIREAVPQDFRRVLMDPKTRGLAVFAHGGRDASAARTLVAVNNEDVLPETIRRWAQEKLASSQPWAAEMLAAGGGMPPAWATTVSSEERLWRRARFDKAHFQLDHVYLHVCHGLATPEFIGVLAAAGGTVRGYEGVARLSDRGRDFLAPLDELLTTAVVPPPKTEFVQGERFRLEARDAGGSAPLKHTWQFEDGTRIVSKAVELTATKAGWAKVFLTTEDSADPGQTARGDLSYKVLSGPAPEGAVAESDPRVPFPPAKMGALKQAVFGCKKHPTDASTYRDRLELLRGYFVSLAPNDRTALVGATRFATIETTLEAQGDRKFAGLDRLLASMQLVLF